MSDRVKGALRALDDIGPDASLFQRARQGPQHPEPPTGSSRGRRAVAGVTAVAVFALAAGYAWHTWRAADDTPAQPHDQPTATSASTYTDPMGWSLAYLSSWSLTPIDNDLMMVTERGAIVANHPDVLASPNAATPSPIGPEEASSPGDLVAVRIMRTEGGPPMSGAPGPDSTFPIDPSDLKPVPGGGSFDDRFLNFRANGLVYELVLIAGPEATPSELASADAVIRSIRPASLDPASKEPTEGFRALFEPNDGYPPGAGTPILLGTSNVAYLLRPPNGPEYVMDVVPDTCGEGQDQSWDPHTLQVLITCPDGTEIRYDANGSADASNPAQYLRHLDLYPVSRSWDGQRLVFMGAAYRVPANAWTN